MGANATTKGLRHRLEELANNRKAGSGVQIWHLLSGFLKASLPANGPGQATLSARLLDRHIFAANHLVSLKGASTVWSTSREHDLI